MYKLKRSERLIEVSSHHFSESGSKPQRLSSRRRALPDNLPFNKALLIITLMSQL